MDWIKLTIPAAVSGLIVARGGTPIGAALVMRGGRTLRTYASLDDSGRRMEYLVNLSVIDGGVRKQPNDLDIEQAARHWFGLSGFRVEGGSEDGVNLWADVRVAKAKGVA